MTPKSFIVSSQTVLRLAYLEAVFAFSSDGIHDSGFILSGAPSAQMVVREILLWDLRALSLYNELSGDVVELSWWLSSFDSKKDD